MTTRFHGVKFEPSTQTKKGDCRKPKQNEPKNQKPKTKNKLKKDGVIMAKSIYEILDDLQTETSTKNGMVGHTLPRELFPTSEEFEDGEKLLKWANEKGITHAVLQNGIQKFLITARAVFKSEKKEETWTADLGQAKVNEMTWEVVKRPGTGTNKKVDQARFNDCLVMIGNLNLAKMKTDKIREIVTKAYGEEIVTACFAYIEKAQAETK